MSVVENDAVPVSRGRFVIGALVFLALGGGLLAGGWVQLDDHARVRSTRAVAAFALLALAGLATAATLVWNARHVHADRPIATGGWRRGGPAVMVCVVLAGAVGRSTGMWVPYLLAAVGSIVLTFGVIALVFGPVKNGAGSGERVPPPTT
jgi:hypothetical protein